MRKTKRPANNFFWSDVLPFLILVIVFIIGSLWIANYVLGDNGQVCRSVTHPQAINLGCNVK